MEVIHDTVAQPCDASHWMHLLENWRASQGEWPCEFRIACDEMETQWMPIAIKPEAKVA